MATIVGSKRFSLTTPDMSFDIEVVITCAQVPMTDLPTWRSSSPNGTFVSCHFSVFIFATEQVTDCNYELTDFNIRHSYIATASETISELAAAYWHTNVLEDPSRNLSTPVMAANLTCRIMEQEYEKDYPPGSPVYNEILKIFESMMLGWPQQ